MTTTVSDSLKTVLVSLIICTRNRARFLGPFLESLRRIERSHPWEIIIVDNDSQDETWFTLNKFREYSGLPVVLVKEKQRGLGNARNAGIKVSKGSFLIFTDDDCYPQPDFIDSIVKVFRNNDVDFFGGRVLQYDPTDYPVCLNVGTAQKYFPPGGFIPPGEIQGACMAFRREVIARMGLFDPAFGAGTAFAVEDSDMITRACFDGFSAGFFPETAVYHHHRRKKEGAKAVTKAYEYGTGAYMAKLIMDYPQHRYVLIKNWYWSTPIFSKRNFSTVRKACRECLGALHYTARRALSRFAPLRRDAQSTEVVPGSPAGG
jgi:glycosyltransferase involved in cell wall biosynthesis